MQELGCGGPRAPDFEKVVSLLRDAFGSSTIIHFSIVLGLVIKDDLGPSLVSCFDVGIIPQDLCVSNGLQAVELKPHVDKTLAKSERGLVLELSKHTRQIHVVHQCTKKHV